ncbi:solute carrier family 49 member A3 isoform X2 [Ambystoma mexicanum]|uniref:solute carrier family 49 member A3 isoform X2 n=1 Tax=Ambystoma mexicanum TaxID=8296 RepID=UPI0037E87C4F
MAESSTNDLAEEYIDAPAGQSGAPAEAWSGLRKLMQYKTYRMRWYLLGVICLLNCSNSMLWLSFAPVADKTAKFYGCSLDQVNWLSQVYLIIAIPFGILTMWVLDILGLKTAVILSAWLNMLGSVVRYFGVLLFISKEIGYPLLLLGQCICAVAQPLVLFSPTKLAAVWFPEHQQATANMMSSMSNPLGILLANLLSPALVHKKEDIPFMVGMYAVPAVLACILATVGVCHSEPPTPPSASAVNSTSEPFWPGLKKLFAGLCGALFIGVGILGAFLLGLYIDRTKNFTEAIKICFAMAALASIAFALVSRLPNQPALVAAVCSLFGFFGFSIYPISMELAVECSYPVGEGTSTGLVFIAGQIQGIIFMLLLQAVTKQLADAPLSACNAELDTPLDWKAPTLLLAGICSVGACIFILFFRTDYKRLHAEAENAAITGGESDTLQAPEHNG